LDHPEVIIWTFFFFWPI